MDEKIEYILNFLIGENSSKKIVSQIGYTKDALLFSKYKLVIYPSPFFDKEVYTNKESLPTLPLAQWNDIPLLFGEARTEQKGETTILYADIIASSFFLLSRYEETIKPDYRDEHGRFPGKKSLPYRADFINRPLVDEYGQELRKLLRKIGFSIEDPAQKIKKIYLTHDVDVLAHFRNLRSIIGAVLRFKSNKAETKNALSNIFGKLENDPWYTFPFLFKKSNELKEKIGEERVESIVFIKPGGGNNKKDRPIQNIRSKDFRHFFELCKENNVKVGLHISYKAGKECHLISEEKKDLENTVKRKITANRNHFLRSREPEDLQELIDNEITDDFTLGYADISGFRLGTSRPVRWINPRTLALTDLTLHPLTLMDVTLSSKNYMNLSEEEAFVCAKKIIEETKKHAGELCLLWHNNSVEKDRSYHRSLYEKIIHHLIKNEG